MASADSGSPHGFDASVRQVLLRAPNPSPWLPKPPVGWHGESITWDKVPGDAMATALISESGQSLLRVGGYTKVGWPDQTHIVLIQELDGNLALQLVAIDSLQPLQPRPDPVERFGLEYEGSPVFSVEVPIVPGAGTRQLAPLLADVTPEIEVMTFVSVGSSEDQLSRYWLYVFDLSIPAVTAVPLKWLTEPGYDLGYQWPVAAARMPGSDSIAAFGIRLGHFTLDEHGNPTFPE